MDVRARVSAALVAAALALGSAPVRSDELTAIYNRILRNPTDVDLNLDYAMMSEARGEYRKALATYDRILINDPNNVRAKEGLQRVRLHLMPSSTIIDLEAGAGWESNPQRLPQGSDSDFLVFGRANLRDERAIGSTLMRTTGAFFGRGYFDSPDVNYAEIGAVTGPVINIGTLTTLNPALGGAAAYFDQHYYFSEAVALSTLETYFAGAPQSLRLRAGYRQYDSFFTSDGGFYADALLRLAHTNNVVQGDAVFASPWLRWSGIDGASTTSTVPFTELAPGRYTEIGVRFDYAVPVTSWLTVAPLIAVSQRYFPDPTPGGTEKRHDFLLIPGVAFYVPGVFGQKADLKLEYNYEYNNSNDNSQDFKNQRIAVSLLKRI